MAFMSAAAAQVAPSSATPDQGSATSSEAQAPAGIGDIVVTASRRAENVQKTALSIQALSADALVRANVAKPEDLAALAPGVQIGTGGAFPQVYIRGVGNYATQAFAESAVAFNLDGVYISRAWATRGMFYDLDRVEVLKGPQGTLYGRNASGGAINIITAKPKLDRTSGFAEFQAGNYSLFQGTAAINLPLGETLAVRASGQVVSRDGYLSDGYNDEKVQSGRLQFLWKPHPDVSLLISGNYQHSGGKGIAGVLTPQLPGDKWRGPSDPAIQAIFKAEPFIGQFLTYPKDDGYTDISVYSMSGELNWNLGFATLTILPAYREAKLHALSYLPGFPVYNDEKSKQTSLEARLGHSGEKLKWVLGGYYFDERGRNLPGQPSLGVYQGVNTQLQQNLKLRTRSYAAFGQATYGVTDRFRVTGGLRYTYEKKNDDELLVNYGFPSQTPPPACVYGFFDPTAPTPPLFCHLILPIVHEKTFKSVTWKAGVEFDLAPRSMAYANVSTGFKSGGFFLAPSPDNVFGPEKLTAFEVGVKNRFLDNRLQINVEGFFWRYRDHQESFVGPTTIPGMFTLLTVNAGRAKSYGADVDLLFLATPQDQLSLKVQYNKSKFDSFVFPFPSTSLGAPVSGCSVGPVTVGGFQNIDCSGKPLQRAPLWSGNAGYSHTFDLGGHGKLMAAANARFASVTNLSIDYLESTRQEPYAVVDFDLTYTSDDGRWMVTGFIHNIGDRLVKNQAYRSNFVSPANPLAHQDGAIFASIGAPRTFGGRVRFNF